MAKINIYLSQNHLPALLVVEVPPRYLHCPETHKTEAPGVGAANEISQVVNIVSSRYCRTHFGGRLAAIFANSLSIHNRYWLYGICTKLIKAPAWSSASGGAPSPCTMTIASFFSIYTTVRAVDYTHVYPFITPLKLLDFCPCALPE